MIGRSWRNDRNALPLHAAASIGVDGLTVDAKLDAAKQGGGQSLDSVHAAMSAKYQPLRWWPSDDDEGTVAKTTASSGGGGSASGGSLSSAIVEDGVTAAEVEALSLLLSSREGQQQSQSSREKEGDRVLQLHNTVCDDDAAPSTSTSTSSLSGLATASSRLRTWSAGVRHPTRQGFGRALTLSQLPSLHPCISHATPSPPLSPSHFVIIAMCSSGKAFEGRLRAVNAPWAARARALGATVLLVSDAPVGGASGGEEREQPPSFSSGGGAGGDGSGVRGSRGRAGFSDIDGFLDPSGVLLLPGALDPSYAGAQNRSLMGLQYAVAHYPHARWYWMVDDDTWVSGRGVGVGIAVVGYCA